MPRAAIFGSTGLIGSELLKYINDDKYFSEVNVITRKNIPFKNSKFKNIVIDFNDIDSIKSSLKECEVVFVSIGTTQSKVKWDLEKYKKIDYEIPINISKACIELNIEKYLIVSSAGANINAKGFYLSLKGKIENEIINMGIKNTYIYRPSLLLGKRNENRFGEKIAQVIMPIFSFLLPKKYKPINAEFVAKSMINSSKNTINSVKIFHYEDIIKSK
jgi:nucleoside-diphosphate-sugar epimerase|tara:strand:+ start:440 stop:1090 length:651 start_codon:yes stop_codon:yes gene_type:complete